MNDQLRDVLRDFEEELAEADAAPTPGPDLTAAQAASLFGFLAERPMSNIVIAAIDELARIRRLTGS